MNSVCWEFNLRERERDSFMFMNNYIELQESNYIHDSLQALKDACLSEKRNSLVKKIRFWYFIRFPYAY